VPLAGTVSRSHQPGIVVVVAWCVRCRSRVVVLTTECLSRRCLMWLPLWRSFDVYGVKPLMWWARVHGRRRHHARQCLTVQDCSLVITGITRFNIDAVVSVIDDVACAACDFVVNAGSFCVIVVVVECRMFFRCCLVNQTNKQAHDQPNGLSFNMPVKRNNMLLSALWCVQSDRNEMIWTD